jgi:hypothetical protein
MCEYCGCQEIATIGELTREHDAVVAEIALVRRFLSEDNVDGAGKSAARIAEILAPHTIVEEKGLFPLMEGDFPDHIHVLEHEHRVIEAVLSESAMAVPADPSWPGRLLATLELLRDHILKEQDGVFPASVTILDAVGWQGLEELRARVGNAIDPEPQHFHDEEQP